MYLCYAVVGLWICLRHVEVLALVGLHTRRLTGDDLDVAWHIISV